MHKKEFQKLLKKYRKGLCTPEEEALVETWFRSMGSLHDLSGEAPGKSKIKERSWTRVRDHIGQSRERKTSRMAMLPVFRTRYGPAWAVAAVILLLIVPLVFLVINPGQTGEQSAGLQAAEKSISNDGAEAMEVLLQDGSRVLLQPKSSISFTEPFDISRRLVTLEGEAFFSVSRDTLRPFVVATKEVITKVLGTSFTVSAFLNDDNVTVAVMTGKVSVMTKKDEDAAGPLKETILTPNQKMIYNKRMHAISRAIVNEPVPILSADVVRRMRFEAAPVREIFEGLEQVYGVDIEFDAHTFSSCTLTTSIAGGNIYNRLDMICKAVDARYVIKENRIVITGAGCGQ